MPDHPFRTVESGRAGTAFVIRAFVIARQNICNYLLRNLHMTIFSQDLFGQESSHLGTLRFIYFYKRIRSCLLVLSQIDYDR